MIRRLGLLRWLLYLALPLLVIYFTLNVMLTSTVFSRFVLDRLEAVAPELQFTQVEGNFIRGLSLNFRYTGADQDVQAQGLTLQLGLECLWQLKLCIRSLHIDQLRLALSPSEEARPESESGLELPEVELPLEIELRSLLIGRLQLVEDEKTLYELTGLDAALRWQGSTLFVERLALADEWCRWAGEGEIKLTEHYPVDVALACASLQGFGSASAQIDGDLQQLQVALNARVTSVYSAEAANIRAAVSMALTDAELPFTAQVQLDPVRLAVDDMLIQLQASELALHGPLLSPAIQGVLNFESPFWAGENKLTLDAKASTEALRINSLLLQLPEGEMTVEGLLDYSEALSWQGQVSWQNIALEQFAEGFNGRLHGSVDSAADYRDDKLRAELNLSAVGGTLLDRSFAAAGKLRYDDQVLEVVDLDLRQGENHLQLAGELAFEQASNLRLRLKLPQLRQLIPEQWLEQFEGAVEGELHLTGSIEQPALEAGLRVQNLSYDDISLQEGTLQLNWQGADEPDVNFSLVLDRLGLGEDLLAQLNLSGRGRQSAHQLSLEARGLAQHQDKRLLLHCEGGFPRTLLDTWRGQCDRLDVDFALSEPQQWRLREPVTFVISPGAPAVELSAFCLVYQNASLCSEQSVQYRNNSLSPITVGGKNFAADWFQGFVPTQELQLAGSWGVRFSAMDIVGGEPQLSASLFSTDLAAIWNDAQGPLRLQAENLSLTWTLAQQRHRINWALDTTDNGTSRGNLSLAGEAIDGRVIISGIELADYGQLFLPMEDDELAGQLNADLAVSGTLAQPSLNGRVDLEGGVSEATCCRWRWKTSSFNWQSATTSPASTATIGRRTARAALAANSNGRVWTGRVT